MLAEISVLVFWATFLSALSARNIWMGRKDPVEERMRRILPHEGTAARPDLLVATNESPGTLRLRQKLLMAGLSRKRDFQNLLRLRHVCFLVPILVGFSLFLMGFPLLQIIFVVAISAFIFILIPGVWLFRRTLKRRQQMERHLPTALDLLILCLEAGLSFDSSLVRVAEEQRRVSPDLSREFVLTNQEILAGKSREEALKNLIFRTRVEEIRSLVGAIIQSSKLGTSLVKTLRIQAQAMRKKRRERVRAQILKTPVKLIFPLIFFIFPTLLIVILGPSLVNIFRELSRVGY